MEFGAISPLRMGSWSWKAWLGEWDEAGILELPSQRGQTPGKHSFGWGMKLSHPFPSCGLTSLNLESTGGGGAALFCFPQAQFHVWPLSPSPALDTALKMGC